VSAFATGEMWRGRTAGCASVLSPEPGLRPERDEQFDPLSIWNGSSLWPVRALFPNPLLIRDSGGGDGAFMEPSGRNQWQPAANARAPKSALTSQNRCHRLRPVAGRSARTGGGRRRALLQAAAIHSRRGKRHPAHIPHCLPTRATTHPALIPQEVPGSSRRYPPILATAVLKSPAHAANPRLSPLRPEAP
jgi:hypothetical protein